MERALGCFAAVGPVSHFRNAFPGTAGARPSARGEPHPRGHARHTRTAASSAPQNIGGSSATPPPLSPVLLGASEPAPEAVRQAVGGGCQSGWGRLLSVTNAMEADAYRQGDSGWALAGRPGGGGGGGVVPPTLPMHPWVRPRLPPHMALSLSRAAVSAMSPGKPPQSQDLQTWSCGLVARPRPRASCLGLCTAAGVSPTLSRVMGPAGACGGAQPLHRLHCVGPQRPRSGP